MTNFLKYFSSLWKSTILPSSFGGGRVEGATCCIVAAVTFCFDRMYQSGSTCNPFRIFLIGLESICS